MDEELVFITGNQHKADYLAKWLALPVTHQKVELDELQSLDTQFITTHKAEQAYQIVKRPVLVEDVGLTFKALGRLPGPLIKWFLEELGNDGLCKLVGGYTDRRATASIIYGLCDGSQTLLFSAQVDGTIAPEPRGEHGFGWNAIFIPDGSSKTYAEMDDEEIVPFSHRAKAIEKLRAYLVDKSSK